LFKKEGKKFDSLEIAVMSINNAMKYAQYVLVGYLTKAISSTITEKLGFRDIANYIRSYEKYRHEYDMGDDRRFVRVLCNLLQTLIDDYSWYIHYIPQILGKCLYWITFREGKPLHELDYKIGINMDDYKKMGLG
jgi:hypothetical protein